MTTAHNSNSQVPALVFTDLDGTLLDHDTYQFAEALPALRLLQSLNIPLIPTTSKTVAELRQINERLNNSHPFIAENGCIIGFPDGYFPISDMQLNMEAKVQHQPPYTLLTLAPLYTEVLHILQTLRDEQGFRFQGFNDLSVCEIAKLTQLPLPQAELAKQRLCSEPLIWLDDDSKLDTFKTVLQKYNLGLVKGGRFWHVFGPTNKGLAMEKLIALYQRHGMTNPRIIALGDSPNDIEMLVKAHIAIAITQKNGTQLANLVTDSIKSHLRVCEKPGPEGWNKALIEVIQQL